jgi:histidine triad (HIT) family protein
MDGTNPGRASLETSEKAIGKRDAMTDCILCRLTTREEEVSIVHEDGATVTLMDLQPVLPGHMLVVPKTHASGLSDLAPEDGERLFRAAQIAAAALRRSGLRCEGVNLFLADGAAAGQEIFHVHLHVWPRYVGDGFELRPPPGYSVRPRAELDGAAAAIRQAWQPTPDLDE